jgi:hypothetical protein
LTKTSKTINSDFVITTLPYTRFIV